MAKSRERRNITAGRFDDSEVYSLDWTKQGPELTRDGKTLSTARSEQSTTAKDPQGLPALELGKKGYIESADARPVASDKPFHPLHSLPQRQGRHGRHAGARKPNPVWQRQRRSSPDLGWRLEIDDGLPRLFLIMTRARDFGMRAIGDERAIKTGEWHHVAVTYDRLRQREGITLYMDGEQLPMERLGRALRACHGDRRRRAARPGRTQHGWRQGRPRRLCSADRLPSL
ncbi:MAG: LamG-like jellyroll fold domain-containing protein [Bryobacterales bacterium]